MDMNKKAIHGGDIYRNHVQTDFSVNTNPLGIPETVKNALHKAVAVCDRYPDREAEHLRKAVSDMLHIPEEYLLFGNGASELFMAVVHSIQPKKTVIQVPSFYGYEYAAKAGGGKILYYETKEDNSFCAEADFFSVLDQDVELLFLANPNNPTGNLVSREWIRAVLEHCRDRKIHVVLDECFIEFCTEDCSMLQEAEQYANLILVRAFTKIFAIPGVRLGYLVCSNQTLLQSIGRQLPEWNLSGFAQAAGCAGAGESDFIKRSARYVKEERQFLENGLRNLGMKVYAGKANFLLFYTKKPIYSQLLERGILIRDCENYRGLSGGFYRVAVKNREENELLLKRMGEIFWKK